ncbi:MAG: hypothetical protein DME61_11815 [Verrucomicrobia bacterium]|nr:MAG: hypothetical protein DME61_11815 [Verrucomicrobiota bacterium]
MVVVLRGEIKPQTPEFPRRSGEFIPPFGETDADGLAVAVVLTLEFAEIANVRVRLDHVASLIVNANHCIMGTAEKREMLHATRRKQAI